MKSKRTSPPYSCYQIEISKHHIFGVDIKLYILFIFPFLLPRIYHKNKTKSWKPYLWIHLPGQKVKISKLIKNVENVTRIVLKLKKTYLILLPFCCWDLNRDDFPYSLYLIFTNFTDMAWASEHTSLCSLLSCPVSMTRCSSGHSDRRSRSCCWIKMMLNTWLMRSGLIVTALHSRDRRGKRTWQVVVRWFALWPN